MMNSNDQPPPSGPLDFQPRRSNDRAMLSRLSNLEHEMAAVRTTVEVIRSNYVTKEDLAREVGALGARIEATASELNNKIEATASELNNKIEATASELNNKIEATASELNNKIEATASELNNKIEATASELSNKIEATASELSNKIEATASELSNKIEATASELNGRIVATAGELNDKIGKANDNTHSLRAELHAEITRQTWRIVGFVTVLCSGLTGAVFYIARYVH